MTWEKWFRLGARGTTNVMHTAKNTSAELFTTITTWILSEIETTIASGVVEIVKEEENRKQATGGCN